MLTERDLPAQVVASQPPRADAIPDTERPTLTELKRRYVQLVLAEQAGNITRAARVLGIDRRSLHRMLERFATGTPDPETED